ncbi:MULTISPECIES: hypothetical protein [unclassified Nocardioides]|uniref:hypothetical protein n=1 Tax=unclassified Nocardioides TaxID=2615069 RepID=UPI003015249B
MSGKQRTVYFFEPVVIDKKGNAKSIAAGFWKDIHTHIGTLDEDDRRTIYRGRKLEGEATFTKSPAAEYLYIAKLRPGADWPDVRGVDGTHGTLASTGAVGALLEPAYLVEVSNTKYCAVLRSSGGPSFSALESWLSMAGGYTATDSTLELRPFVREDQLERLAVAQGATKIRLRVEPHALEDAEPTSDLGRAMADAQQAVGGGVSVEMTVSFGHVRPDGPAARQLTDAVSDILREGGVKHASATLLVPGEDGELERDKIDFVRDRVTFIEEVGESEDEEPSAPVVMAAMAEAIQEFKKQL